MGERSTASLVADASRSSLYQPLAVGDSWTYTCRDIKGGGENGGKPFAIRDRVVGKTTIGARNVFEFSQSVPRVPSAPLTVVNRIMLLNNDASGDLWIYGYRVHGKIRKIEPAKIVSSLTPAMNATFNYIGPSGKMISRIFFGIEPTNPTPLGVFTVADYEESENTHDYGYARGKGIAEEDHGPNFEVDCLIAAMKLH
jgi:hypothetical protein